MQLEELLESPIALPSVPRVIAMVLSELNQEEPEVHVISQLINSDVGLAARVIGLANSSLFNLNKKIGSVPEALAILGLQQVHALAVAAAVSRTFKFVPGLVLPNFWRYSLNVAKLSRKLTRLARANWAVSFTAGLIHGAGELVMHVGMPNQMAWLNEGIDPLASKRAQSEIQLLGYCYAEVGAALAKNWGFPDSIVKAIAHQHAPFKDKMCEPLAGVLHLASWRARALEENLTANQLADTFPYEVALTLNLDIDEVIQTNAFNWTTPQESNVLSG